MGETAPNQAAIQEIWPTYALRAWLTSLQAQTRRAQEDLEARIDTHEKEIARLRRQHERAATILHSLQATIERVDARLRHVRDSESFAKATSAGTHAHHPEREEREKEPGESSQGRAASSRPRPR